MSYIRCPRCNSQYFMISDSHVDLFKRMLRGEIVSFREYIPPDKFDNESIVLNLKEDAKLGFIGCNYSRETGNFYTFKVKASQKLIDMQNSSFKATIVPPRNELYCDLCEQKIQVPYYCSNDKGS